ncbi:MAG: ATP-dependent DNA helicase RecG, partial [Silicimonas sp.]|nr:ATP-dependent DNA helicase RecG [Silicimonas sp.]
MSGRPEILFPIFASLETLPGVGEKTARLFHQIDVETPRDLLFTLPTSGVDRRFRPTIRGLTYPVVATTEVTVEQHHRPRTKGRPYRVDVSDGEMSFQLVFFHARDDWLARQLPVGERRVVSGRIELFDGLAQMVHPEHILPPDEKDTLPDFEPVYPLTQGVSLKVMT